MLGRVTQNMTTSALLSNLNDLTGRMGRTQTSISSGKQITKPSDDPLGTQRDLGLRGALQGAQQQQRNVDQANGWLQSTDSALADIGDVINRVRELTVQGASDSLGDQQRSAIALEIDQLIDSVKDSANATFQGTFVFGGTKTTTSPYSNIPLSPGPPPVPNDAYQGDAGTIARSIGPGISVQVNTDISALLGSGGGDGKLIDTMRQIATDLRSGSSTGFNALRNGDLKALTDNQDSLNQSRATVGATMSRLDSAKSRLQDIETTTTKLLSETEDTDLAKAILELTNQQNVYQAALRSGASIIQPSLLDFLR
jgi:flagellar hook-associated protein 3 FlgL